jgi:hypothetical protein
LKAKLKVTAQIYCNCKAAIEAAGGAGNNVIFD